jgi:DNA (cytosine-5)-methyltransferase 1
MTIKILNLYAGIGGNRKLWNGDIEVTAIENVPEIAKIYQDFFPQDKVIITDAHQYLLEHFKEFDFIWSSPPCPSHSKVRFITQQQNKPIYPEMSLYQEIIFLDNYFKGKWVVENVKPYYEPLIKAQECGRHLFWCNFIIAKIDLPTESQSSSIVSRIAKRKGIDCNFKALGLNKVKLIRNAVQPELGLHIFELAFKKPQLTLNNDIISIKILNETK